MSSKNSKKCVAAKVQPILTRNKTAQLKKQPKNKNKKPETPQIKNVPETKVSKVEKSTTTSDESILRNRLKKKVIEQEEYYPNKLKRNVCPKKIKLKPKHNFRVIASTNKRKMAVPQQGTQSPQPTKKQKTLFKFMKSPNTKVSSTKCKSPQLSMEEMIRLAEETGSLCEEDFMEILTCPSPVWWEDPPDWRYSEDSICTMCPESPQQDTVENEKTNTDMKIETNRPKENILFKQIKPVPNKNSEKFVKKQLKLENILGNIKNKTIKNKPDVDINKIPKNDERSRKVSENTEDYISDSSFNEDEVLKNLENMEIPTEQNIEQNDEVIVVKKEKKYENIEIKSENSDIDKDIKIKTEFLDTDVSLTKIKAEIKSESPDNFEEIDENISNDKCIDSNRNNIDNLTEKGASVVENKVSKITKTNTESNTKKPINDLTEYITVYKIIPENIKTENKSENIVKNTENKTKSDTVRLNNFFKHCKNNRRVIKTENSKDIIDIKDDIDVTIIESDDETNRLKPEQSGCEKSDCDCEKSDNLPCACKCVDESKVVYSNNVSNCKNGARLSWSNNLMTNQT